LGDEKGNGHKGTKLWLPTRPGFRKADRNVLAVDGGGRKQMGTLPKVKGGGGQVGSSGKLQQVGKMLVE